MNTTVISCGSTRYPESGGMAAAPGKGINVLDLALYPGAKAKEIWLSATGDITVVLNGEDIKPYLAEDEKLKFTYKGEAQRPGGKRYGTIEFLEIIGDGHFNLLLTE